MSEAPRHRGDSRGPGKPWYLVLALLLCIFGFGGCGATAGWQTIELYRGVQLESPADDLAHDDSRKAIATAFAHWTAALDAERPRGFPLAVAELVLGLALSGLALGAWVGRNGARRAVLQITIAQAALVIAAFVLTPKARAAEIDWQVQVAAAKMIEAGQPAAEVDHALPALHVFSHASSIVALVIRTLFAGLVIVALTRPRALQFYEPQSESPNES